MKEYNRDVVNLLLVDPDENLAQILSGYFEAKNYRVTHFASGKEAFDSYLSSRYDVCVMELDMPENEGWDLLRTFRNHTTVLPILCLTNLTGKREVIAAFRAGCDDYLTKPFNIEELMLRIEALLRRAAHDDSGKDRRTIFQIGSYEFDLLRQVLIRNGVEHSLTTKETGLLHQLALKKNQLLTREYALKVVWSEYNVFNARSMDVYITRLRKLLRDDPDVEIINVRGKGFKLIA